MTSQNIRPLSSSQQNPGLGERLYMRCYAGNYLTNRKLKSKYSYLKTEPSPIPFISITPNYLSQSTKKLKSSKEIKNQIPTSIKKELDDIIIINKYSQPAKPLNELIDYSNKLYNYSKKYQIDKEKNEKKYYEQFSYQPIINTNNNNNQKNIKNFYVRLEGWLNKMKMKNNDNKNNIIDEKTGQVLFKPKINKSNRDNNNNKNVFENLYRNGMNSKLKRKNDEEKYYNKIKQDSNKKFFNKENKNYIESSKKKKIFEKILEIFHKYKNDNKLIDNKIHNNEENDKKDINNDENNIKKYFIEISDELYIILYEFYKSIEDNVNKEKFFDLLDKMYNKLNDNLKKEFLKIKFCN